MPVPLSTWTRVSAYWKKVDTPAHQLPDFQYRMVNPAFEKHTGLTNVIGKTIQEVVPQIEQSTLAIYDQVAFTGEATHFQTYVASLGLWIEAHASRISQHPAQVAVLFSNITERHHQERDQEFLISFRDTLRALPDAETIIDVALKRIAEHLSLDRAYIATVYRAEDRAEIGPEHHRPDLRPISAKLQMSDFPEGFRQVEEQTLIIENIATDSTLTDLDKASLGAIDLIALVVTSARKGERDVIWSMVAATTQPRKWMASEVTLLETVTERTWAAIERARAEAVLRQEGQRKDEFLAMLGHELRNPLAAMTNTLLVLQLTQGQDESMPYAKGIQILTRHSQHLNRMVDDLLDMSRIRQGIVRLQWEVVNLAQLLRLTVEAAQSLYREQHRQLSLSLPAQPLYVRGDEARLAQIVMNLLTNGAKYTDPGGQVWVSLELVEHQAILRVLDTGIGLTKEEQTSIFEVFVQGATSLDRPHGGLGLGLAVVKHLVEGHGGQIQALSSGLGQGSEFIIRLPILSALAETVPTHKDDLLSTSGRVLVVDDNIDFADTTARLLRSKGFEVYTRYSGAQGLAGAESLRPDALLLDIGMPYMDGYEVCRQIRTQSWGQPMAIIALTGYGLETDKKKAVQAGFDGHLLKPVNLSTMAQVVAGAIHRRQSH